MKNIDELVKRVEYFERLATHGDRKSLLKSLAQAEPNASYEIGAPDPKASVEPYPTAPSGVMNMPADHITGLRPIDPNVQNMLNVLLDDQIVPLMPDGRIGEQTKAALRLFKKNYGKPASVAAITTAYNDVMKKKQQEAVAQNPVDWDQVNKNKQDYIASTFKPPGT